MFPRLAASFLSLCLVSSAAAHGSFAEPPPPVADRADRIVQIDRIPEASIDAEAPSRAQVRTALAKRRAKSLAAFRAYRLAGSYPHNDVRFGPVNIWIDSQGRLCAAATIMSKDGHHGLVLETGRVNNQIRLQNVTQGALLDWMMMSGLTIEEIDRIQVPMIEPEVLPVIEHGIAIARPDYAAEDAKLAKGYARTDATLVKATNRSLDIAVDRLMKDPVLAAAVVAMS